VGAADRAAVEQLQGELDGDAVVLAHCGPLLLDQLEHLAHLALGVGLWLVALGGPWRRGGGWSCVCAAHDWRRPGVPLAGRGSVTVAAVTLAIGVVLVVLAILKTWWDSRLSFLSGVVYLIVLNVAYLLLRNSRRRPRA